MKIALVFTDSQGKNLVFATDALKAYSLDESIKIARQGDLESVHDVKTGRGAYLRSDPNTTEDDNLDALSISAYQIFLSLDDIKYLLSQDGRDAYKKYLKLHWSSIEERGEHVIYIDGYPLITKEQVIAKLIPHRQRIITAAKRFTVDPYILGAIIIDEIARANPWEDALDKIGAAFVGINTSAGVAQVKIETARGLIRDGYYNPNPNDKKLSREKINKTSRAYLYAYVEQPRHSIHFSAARIREVIDDWMPKIDLSNRPDIIGTLYSQGNKVPHDKPTPNSRGLQISREFYPLAKRIIKP